jgi:hypothetical protein
MDDEGSCADNPPMFACHRQGLSGLAFVLTSTLACGVSQVPPARAPTAAPPASASPGVAVPADGGSAPSSPPVAVAERPAPSGPAPASVADGSSVTGTFTVNGKNVPVTHVYALMKPDIFDESRDVLSVVLSTAAIEEARLRSQGGLLGPTVARPIVEVGFNGEGTPTGVDLHSEKSNRSISGTHVTNFVPQRFEAGKVIAGKLFSSPPDVDATDVLEYSVTFSAPIMPKPRQVSAALNSPPALAAQAFARALATRSEEAIKKTILPNTDLKDPESKMIIAVQTQVLGDKNMKIAKVLMQGEDTAEVRFEHKENDTTSRITMRAARVNGAWFVVLK